MLGVLAVLARSRVRDAERIEQIGAGVLDWKLSKPRFLIAHSRRQAIKDASEASVHVALIAEARIDRNLAAGQICLAQQPNGMFDAQARRGLPNAFPDGLPVCRSQPGRVPIELSCRTRSRRSVEGRDELSNREAVNAVVLPRLTCPPRNSV